jgi:hypothetical protein
MEFRPTNNTMRYGKLESPPKRKRQRNNITNIADRDIDHVIKIAGSPKNLVLMERRC